MVWPCNDIAELKVTS